MKLLFLIAKVNITVSQLITFCFQKLAMLLQPRTVLPLQMHNSSRHYGSETVLFVLGSISNPESVLTNKQDSL